MSETKKQFDDLVATVNENYEKHLAGNKAAGTRVRVALSNTMKVAKQLRVEIQEAKNS